MVEGATLDPTPAALSTMAANQQRGSFVGSADRFLSPAEAARRLGISTKALRLYEQRSLVSPLRTAAGWRAYGPREIDRALEIVALRALGFSLSQVQQVLGR